ncbi:hypothetical protein AOLI_G00222210 [Acnodon oligacanthus]
MEAGARSLSERIRKACLVTVRHVVETAGVDLNDAEALAQRLWYEVKQSYHTDAPQSSEALAEEDRKLDRTSRRSVSPGRCQDRQNRDAERQHVYLQPSHCRNLIVPPKTLKGSRIVDSIRTAATLLSVISPPGA